MKMDIVESDLKQLFMWIKNHERGFKTLDGAIVQLQEAYKIEAALVQTHQDAIESLEKRIINLELLMTQEDNK
jgi:hypothetical protein